jgi:hypothetical protein
MQDFFFFEFTFFNKNKINIRLNIILIDRIYLNLCINIMGDNGILKGPGAMPQQFYSYREGGGSIFAAARNTYRRTTLSGTNLCASAKAGLAISVQRNRVSHDHFNYGRAGARTNNNLPNPGIKKCLGPNDSSSYTYARKINAIGKSSNTTGYLGFSGAQKSYVNSRRQYTRSGGAVAPKKKGLIGGSGLPNGSYFGSGGNRQIRSTNVSYNNYTLCNC